MSLGVIGGTAAQVDILIEKLEERFNKKGVFLFDIVSTSEAGKALAHFYGIQCKEKGNVDYWFILWNGEGEIRREIMKLKQAGKHGEVIRLW